MAHLRQFCGRRLARFTNRSSQTVSHKQHVSTRGGVGRATLTAPTPRNVVPTSHRELSRSRERDEKQDFAQLSRYRFASIICRARYATPPSCAPVLSRGTRKSDRAADRPLTVFHCHSKCLSCRMSHVKRMRVHSPLIHRPHKWKRGIVETLLLLCSLLPSTCINAHFLCPLWKMCEGDCSCDCCSCDCCSCDCCCACCQCCGPICSACCTSSSRLHSGRPL